MSLSNEFPNLTSQNHRVTSPASKDYNCIAWAAKDTEHWWQPGVFWPLENSPEDFGISILIQCFESLGFMACQDEKFEASFEKIAIYGSGSFYTHAARQLPDGKWTSKLGKTEDIEHDSPEVVAGGIYGDLVQFMKRAMA
jgi:hypothetical protein